MNEITLVTGLWNLGRETLTEGWSRTYSFYLEKLKELLKVENNLIIFGDSSLREFVFQHRNEENTQFILRDLNWFKTNDYFNLIQKIRTDETWLSQVGWLRESTQAKLEMYNPLVMSKMFLLHDAKILDKFNSDYLFWIDAGLSNTVHPGYFTHDRVLVKIPKLIDKFTFICFPYQTTTEIHGFRIDKMNELANEPVNKVARGGFFGGPKNIISDINSIYYSLLLNTLKEGLMGTEESIFTLMVYRNPEFVDYFTIESNGLLGKFFEDVKNNTSIKKTESKQIQKTELDLSKVALYVITFNSTKQLETLIKSMLDYDSDLINKTKKFLLNNSTDERTMEGYDTICKQYGFDHIKKDNLGICGGRQFIAEHFDKSENDYMFFFEDDMFFYNIKGSICKNGFNRVVQGIYQTSLEIMQKENFDFLKLNYSEFFGDNGTQWSWYNVPQDVRQKYFPEKTQLPKQGLDPNAPRTKFNNIKVHKNVPYIDGEIYYCNWPQIVSKSGNKKMFLETTWAHPFEQTWMSYMFQLTREKKLKPGLLLLSPTEHNRFEHYERELRKES